MGGKNNQAGSRGWIELRTVVLLAALIALALYANSRTWRAHDESLSLADRTRLQNCVTGLLARPAPGISAAPIQSQKPSCEAFAIGDTTVTPLADFVIQARVLSKERYRFDAGAKFAPLDLALGWGPMADPVVLKDIDISQSGRFFFWVTPTFPIPREQIERSAANMHILPGNAQALKMLGQARPQEIIRLWGYLVRINSPSGYTWQSSMKREDTGNGACEVIWVERVELSDVPIGS
jgi:hypothetical protein